MCLSCLIFNFFNFWTFMQSLINQSSEECQLFCRINYKTRNIMQKQVIIPMFHHYPFGQYKPIPQQSIKVLVRLKLPLIPTNLQSITQSAAYLRNLKHQHLINIDSVLEQTDNMHFLYEYVPIKLEDYYTNLNSQSIENIRNQLIKLSNFLADKDIVTKIAIQNIGIDMSQNCKYFLSFDFLVNPHVDRQSLKSSYTRDIDDIFKIWQKYPRFQQSLKVSVNLGNSQKFTKQNNSFRMITNLSYDFNTRELVSQKQRKSQIKRKVGPYLQSVKNSLKVREESLSKSSINDKEKQSRLIKITQKLSEIKSSLSSIQENQKNQQAIQTIEAQMKKTSDDGKIGNNIFEAISLQNKNDMSDNILRQFMDVLQDQQPSVKDQAQNTLQVQVSDFRKTAKTNSNQKILSDDSHNIHDRVNQAITNSMRIIDKFKNLKV